VPERVFLAEKTAESQPLLLKEEEKWLGDFIAFSAGKKTF